MSPCSHRRNCVLTEYETRATSAATVSRIVRTRIAVSLRTAPSTPNAAARRTRNRITQAIKSSYELIGETFDAGRERARVLQWQVVDPFHPGDADGRSRSRRPLRGSLLALVPLGVAASTSEDGQRG